VTDERRIDRGEGHQALDGDGLGRVANPPPLPTGEGWGEGIGCPRQRLHASAFRASPARSPHPFPLPVWGEGIVRACTTASTNAADVGFSATAATVRPSASIAFAVVGPMATIFAAKPEFPSKNASAVRGEPKITASETGTSP